MAKRKWMPSWGLLLTAMLLTACAGAGRMPTPAEVVVPTPIMDNSGEYMSPYTQDDVVAEWCDKAVSASAGSTIGGMVGAYAGQKALEQVPFVGGFLGQKAGSAIGRKIAIEASGGWDFIKSTSDMSFSSIDDMVVWLYATKSTNEHYQDVVKAVGNIYPEFKERQYAAINAARRQ